MATTVLATTRSTAEVAEGVTITMVREAMTSPMDGDHSKVMVAVATMTPTDDNSMAVEMTTVEITMVAGASKNHNMVAQVAMAVGVEVMVQIEEMMDMEAADLEVEATAVIVLNAETIRTVVVEVAMAAKADMAVVRMIMAMKEDSRVADMTKEVRAMVEVIMVLEVVTSTVTKSCNMPPEVETHKTQTSSLPLCHSSTTTNMIFRTKELTRTE